MKTIVLLGISFSVLLGGTYPSLLYHGNCSTCHFETKSVSAPSIKLVRKHYMNAFPNRDKFVKYMSEWVYSPKKETSLMQGAIEKYELMPHLAYDKKTLEEIAGFIYDMKF